MLFFHWSKLWIEVWEVGPLLGESQEFVELVVQVRLCPAFSSLKQLYYLKGVGLGIMLASYVLSLANSRVSCLPLPFPRCGEQKNIDTHPFREAIWYYIHSIKGIRHDDYHYRKVSAHLHYHWVETISIASLALKVHVKQGS